MYALEPENVIAVCGTGPDPQGDARSYAVDYAKAEDRSAYVYGVDVQSIGVYEVVKEVVFRITPK